MDFRGKKRRRVLEFTLAAIAIAAGAGLVWLATADAQPVALQLSIGVIFTLSLVGFIWLFLDPDTREARQSDELLKLASQMLDSAKNGLNYEAAQHICELLLPNTPAIAVAITDTKKILGYVLPCGSTLGG